MNDCPDCQQIYCCKLEGIKYCTNHCIQSNCDCIQCIIQNNIRTTEGEVCRFCDNEACCYISVNTGIIQGQNSYRITRICSTHCPTKDCECTICHEQHDPEEYQTDIFPLPITHPSVLVRDGYPEAQAYVLEPYGPDNNSNREEELRQVTSGPSDASMVPVISEKTGSSKGADKAYKGSRGTRRGRARNRGSVNAGGRSSTRKTGANFPTDDACSTGMQRRKGNNRGRIPVGTTRPGDFGKQHSDRESQNRRRNLRSWKPDGTSASDH